MMTMTTMMTATTMMVVTTAGVDSDKIIKTMTTTYSPRRLPHTLFGMT